MWITIDKKSAISLTRQIYTKLKELILDGSLNSEKSLPSTRALAKELEVSRNTILEVYNQLIAEGYLEGQHGSGTKVVKGISQYPKMTYEQTHATPATHHTPVSDIIDFCSGVPALELFPLKEWGRLYQAVCKELPPSALRYHSPGGVWKLRESISEYLLRTRGIHCTPNNIMIVSGSTQGLSLIANLLYSKTKKVIVEDPVHHGLLKVISSIGYSIIGIEADDKGLNTNLLEPTNNLSFIYTTPSHQYPLGSILPIQRRLALIQYATENNCYIVEDDYDSEFRFEGQPVNSLYELNPDKVIYIGSFSKILAPAIRLGFIILPNKLLPQYNQLKKYSDVHTEALAQYVLSNFINQGSLEKHIWKMKKTYTKKRTHLIQSLMAEFPNEFEIKGHAAGLHVLVHFYKVTFTKQLLQQLYLHKVKIYPVENYTLKKLGTHKNETILGYAHLSFSDITTGIRLLSKCIHENIL